MNEDKVLSKLTVFSSKLLQVEETILESSNGRTRKHFDVLRKPTVSIFPITETYDIYLISQYRPLYKKHIFEGIAGYIEEGEDPLEAAKRELHEETGIMAKNWTKLQTIEMSASVIKAESHMFLARELTLGEADPDEGEDIALRKILLDEAVEKVLSGEITISVSMLGILYLDALRKRGEI